MPRLLQNDLSEGDLSFLKERKLNFKVSASNTETEDGRTLKRTWARITSPRHSANRPDFLTPKIYAEGTDRGSKVRALKDAIAEARGVWGDREMPDDLYTAGQTIDEQQKTIDELVKKLAAMEKQVEDKQLLDQDGNAAKGKRK